MSSILDAVRQQLGPDTIQQLSGTLGEVLNDGGLGGPGGGLGSILGGIFGQKS